jgi:hypothetical protein
MAKLKNKKQVFSLDFDFGKPYRLSGLEFIPFAQSLVGSKETFELFYWDQGGWKSAGIKDGTDDYITFDNLPEGCLYMVKNRNWPEKTGERIFMYEDGIVHWK